MQKVPRLKSVCVSCMLKSFLCKCEMIAKMFGVEKFSPILVK